MNHCLVGIARCSNVGMIGCVCVCGREREREREEREGARASVREMKHTTHGYVTSYVRSSNVGQDRMRYAKGSKET